MKIGVAFSIAAGVMLALMVLADASVGLSPPTPSVSSEERLAHLWLVFTALVLVATVDAAVIWLTLRRPTSDHDPAAVDGHGGPSE